MKILALDISMHCSGIAIFNNNKLIKYFSIDEQKYKGFSKDKYPKKSAMQAMLMANELVKVINEVKPDKIIIEEVSPNGRLMGVKQVKGLCQLHGMLLYQIPDLLDIVEMIAPSGKDGWRNIVNLRKNSDWKLSSVKLANKLLELNLINNQHDISDAILLGHSQIIKK